MSDGMRREVLTWDEVDRLIEHLLPQFHVEFEALLLITRGGIIPGGLLAEALDIKNILTAAVDFPSELKRRARGPFDSGLFAWPRFVQFPVDDLLDGKKILIVDDVWGSGRTITAVKNRVAAAGGTPYTCVLHFNPHRNTFNNSRPDFYAAITDAYIVYPWEIDHGIDKVIVLDEP
jgi:hypoxanthine phosphoribosyltransferase